MNLNEVPVFQTHPIPKIEVLPQDSNLLVSEAIWVRVLLCAGYFFCAYMFRTETKRTFPRLTFYYNWYQILANGILGTLLLLLPCNWLSSCPDQWEYISTLLFLHEITKYVDWLDTVWIILAQDYRRLSFLHIFHHATIPLCWWVAVHSNGTAGWYGAAFNSWVHVVMYAYYAGYFRSLKVWITRIQLIQFTCCLTQSILLYLNGVETTAALFQGVYQVSMLGLFIPFYLSTYTPQTQQKSAKTA